MCRAPQQFKFLCNRFQFRSAQSTDALELSGLDLRSKPCAGFSKVYREPNDACAVPRRGTRLIRAYAIG